MNQQKKKWSQMRTVNRGPIDKWIKENGLVKEDGLDGLTKLAIATGVPSSILSKMRAGYAPKKPKRRLQLTKFFKIPEDELFPVLPDGEEKAS